MIAFYANKSQWDLKNTEKDIKLYLFINRHAHAEYYMR